MKDWLKNDKKMTIGMGIFFLMQILPVLYLGQYNHPTSDDFLYGKAAHDAMLSGGSVLEMIGAAARGVMQDYVSWQGSYAALFFMRLQPAVFGEAYYALVPYLMLGLLTLSTLYFVKTLCDLSQSHQGGMQQHGEKVGGGLQYAVMGLLILMLSLQFSPVPSEQFFWYNSSLYYNAFHAMMLCYLAWAIRYGQQGKWRYLVYMGLGGILLGGGNYVSALFLGILLFTGLVFLWIKGRALGNSQYQKRAWTLLILWVEFLLCFGISMAAPGNAVRAQSTWGYGPVKSVLLSLLQGAKYYQAWIDKWWILVALIMLPMMMQLIKKTNISFSHPLLVIGYLYGAFSAMSCPTFYALGSTGPGRIINIIYDAFLLVSYGQLFYLLGYGYRKWEKMVKGKEDLESRVNQALQQGCISAIGILAGILLFSGSFLETTTVVACKTWLKGEAKQYHLEYMQRLQQLENPEIRDVVFEPYTVEADLVFIADGTDDPEFVNNREWADYYGKNSLTIRPKE